jgi:hypothetical protein
MEIRIGLNDGCEYKYPNLNEDVYSDLLLINERLSGRSQPSSLLHATDCYVIRNKIHLVIHQKGYAEIRSGTEQYIKLISEDFVNKLLRDFVERKSLASYEQNDNYTKDICSDIYLDNSNISFHLAAYKGDKQKVSEYLANGADINEKDEEGFTPLLLAASENQHDIVELLLEHGADIEIRDDLGFHRACNRICVTTNFKYSPKFGLRTR